MIDKLIDYVTDISDDRLSLSGIAVTNMRSDPSWYIYLQDADARVYRGEGTSFEVAAFKAAMEWQRELARRICGD
jgi:hypothetical protein